MVIGAYLPPDDSRLEVYLGDLYEDDQVSDLNKKDLTYVMSGLGNSKILSKKSLEQLYKEFDC